jgi:hypothetical protein
MEIEFDTTHISSEALKDVLKKDTRFSIDTNNLYLINAKDKNSIALLFNVDLRDGRVGWLLKEMCMTSEKFGFIISPFARWYRCRIVECYYAIMRGSYRAHFRLDKLKNGYVFLVISYK